MLKLSLERRAIDVIKQSNVQHVVKLSAMGGREATFPRQHAESEDYILTSGVPYTFLRPNGFMQNMVNYNAATIQAQSAFYGSEGDGRISQIDIRDVAAVAVKALTEGGHVGKAYTLTGPEALTNNEVAQILSAELGRQIRFVNLSPEQLKQLPERFCRARASCKLRKTWSSALDHHDDASGHFRMFDEFVRLCDVV